MKKVILSLAFVMVAAIVKAEGILDSHPGLKYENYNVPTCFYDDETRCWGYVHNDSIKSLLEWVTRNTPYRKSVEVEIRPAVISGGYYGGSVSTYSYGHTTHVYVTPGHYSEGGTSSNYMSLDIDITLEKEISKNISTHEILNRLEKNGFGVREKRDYNHPNNDTIKFWLEFKDRDKTSTPVSILYYLHIGNNSCKIIARLIISNFRPDMPYNTCFRDDCKLAKKASKHFNSDKYPSHHFHIDEFEMMYVVKNMDYLASILK